MKTIDKQSISSYLIESNFTSHCAHLGLIETTELVPLAANCKKLVRSKLWLYLSYYITQSKLRNFYEVVKFVKNYSLTHALSVAIGHMTSLDGNSSYDKHVEINYYNGDPLYTGHEVSDVVHKSLILIGNLSFSFVTCSSLSHGRLDYWGYTKPFVGSVWLTLMGSCVLLTIVLFSQNYAKYSWGELTYGILKAWIDLILTALEGSSPSLQVMFKDLTSRKLLILWAMVTFVLVNTFKSIVTEDTTAPLVSSPPRTFSQVINGGFRVWSSPITKSAYKFLIP